MLALRLASAYVVRWRTTRASDGCWTFISVTSASERPVDGYSYGAVRTLLTLTDRKTNRRTE